MEDPSVSEAHLDECCDICGDVGAIYAIATCTQCKISREHLYCMRTVRYDHPESWCCEDCQDLMMTSSLNNPAKLQYDPTHPDKLSNDVRENPNREKKMQTSKVKPLSAEEVIMLTSGAKTSRTLVKSFFPQDTITRKSRSALARTRVMIGVEDAAQAPLRKVKHTESQEEQPAIASTDIADTKGVQRAVEEATIAFTNTSSLKFDQPTIDSGGGVSDMKIPMAASRSSISFSDAPKVGDFLYIPASDASWKGSFSAVLNVPKKCEVSGAIQAHSPCRVRKKVYESSMLMPQVLNFELVQRSYLWMSLFENYTPGSRDIGLYFFPSSSTRCQNYMSLLEHIGEQDMVLRYYMDGLELLVFTSKILQISCQRWNGLYFLWGLFRRIKLTITKIQAAVNHCHDEGDDDTTVVDMEIDMIGGQNVGKLDIAVPRLPLQGLLPNHRNETFSDIPPGFEKMQQPTGQRPCASAPNHANETFSIIPPGFEKIHHQSYCAEAAMSGVGAGVKVERD